MAIKKAKSGAKNTLCTQRKIFFGQMQWTIWCLNNRQHYLCKNNIRSGKAGEKEICYVKEETGGMAWGEAVYGEGR